MPSALHRTTAEFVIGSPKLLSGFSVAIVAVIGVTVCGAFCSVNVAEIPMIVGLCQPSAASITARTANGAATSAGEVTRVSGRVSVGCPVA